MALPTLENVLQQHDLMEQECGGDGDCFYKSCTAAHNWELWVASDNRQRQQTSNQLRQDISNWLRDCPEGMNTLAANGETYIHNVLVHVSDEFFDMLCSDELPHLQTLLKCLNPEVEAGAFPEYIEAMDDEQKQACMAELHSQVFEPGDISICLVDMVRLMLREAPRTVASPGVKAGVWQCFLQLVSEQGQWNEDVCIEAAAAVLGKQINVIKVNADRQVVAATEVFRPPDEEGRALSAMYLCNIAGAHWRALVPHTSIVPSATGAVHHEGAVAGPATCNGRHLPTQQTVGIHMQDRTELLADINSWPPAVLRRSNDPITTALKQQFKISGVFPIRTTPDPRTGQLKDDQEWRIESRLVMRKTSNPDKPSKRVRGSLPFKFEDNEMLPVKYLHWWLFWAAVHAHKKVFPDDWTDELIRKRFETALQGSPFTAEDYMKTRSAFVTELDELKAFETSSEFMVPPPRPARAGRHTSLQPDRIAGRNQRQLRPSRSSPPQIVNVSSSDDDDDISNDSDDYRDEDYFPTSYAHNARPALNQPFIADHDYESMQQPDSFWQWSGSSLVTERFDTDDFRVARKKPSGPDQLPELIMRSFEAGGVDAFSGRVRPATTGQGVAHLSAVTKTRQIMILIKGKLLKRLSCRQSEWHAPIRVRMMEGDSGHHVTRLTGLPATTVEATEDIPAWSFIDLHTGRICTGNARGKSGKDHLVYWQHGNVHFAVDSALTGNMTAELNDTVCLQQKWITPEGHPLPSAAFSQPGASSCCSSSMTHAGATLQYEPTGYKLDNVQLASARDQQTGRIYIFVLSTREIKQGEELLLAYDIGDLQASEWWQTDILPQRLEHELKSSYKSLGDKLRLWNNVRDNVAMLRRAVACLEGSSVDSETAAAQAQAPGNRRAARNPALQNLDMATLLHLHRASQYYPTAIQRLQRLAGILHPAQRAQMPAAGKKRKQSEGRPAADPAEDPRAASSASGRVADEEQVQQSKNPGHWSGSSAPRASPAGGEGLRAFLEPLAADEDDLIGQAVTWLNRMFQGPHGSILSFKGCKGLKSNVLNSIRARRHIGIGSQRAWFRIIQQDLGFALQRLAGQVTAEGRTEARLEEESDLLEYIAN